MSVAPTVARARPHKTMSETGDSPPEGTAVRVEDIERALVLAREVAAATAKGGSANLRMEHLQALFANGNGRAAPERMQAALEAAGLRADPPVTERPESVALRVDKRRAALSARSGAGAKTPEDALAAEPTGAEPQPRLTGLAAYQAAAGRMRSARSKPSASRPADAGTPLSDAERTVAAEQADQKIAQSIAALMPAMILPVLAASFLGPLFGAAFAGLALLSSALLSRPGALANGKLGPIRMPASLARSFLLLSAGVALGALLTSLALVAAGGGDTKTSDPNAPLDGKATTQQQTTPPAPPSAQQQQQQRAAEQQRQKEAEQRAAERRRAERRRAERRAERRRTERARARERAQQRQAAPPSGAAPDTGTTTTP